MISHDKKIKDVNVLFMGLIFKEDFPDICNSKVFEIINELTKYNCNVDTYDPLINEKDVDQRHLLFIKKPFKANQKIVLLLLFGRRSCID